MCGGMGTYEDVTPLKLRDGQIVYIDTCIHKLVLALNEAGIETFASCCGHGIQAGSILLEDGRELIIAADRTDGDRLMLLSMTRERYYDVRSLGRGEPDDG